MAFVSASTLIKRAFNVCGIFQPGEQIPPEDAADAFDMLAMMIGAWALQPLTRPVVAREVFPLTANLGVYTMGPGGDFDTSRPNRLTGAALLLNSQGTPVSVTSLTRAAGVVTATVTSHGAETGQNVTIAGAEPDAYNGTFPITVTGVNTFTYLFGGSVTSPAMGTMTASFESTGDSVSEVPRSVLTDAAWEAIQIKSMTSAQFTCVYYNPTFAEGLGTINLWPIPNVATNSLVLYRPMQLAPFANQTTRYELPDGLDEAIQYNLARRLLAPYGKTNAFLAAEIRDMAATSLGTFKRGNVKMADLPQDPATTHSPDGYYNILTGNL